MGAISRLRYVIAANVNALLEKAEDPEKLLRALIREMEDASEEARLACADLLAEQQHLERIERQLGDESDEWQLRAERAVAEGRDDLARVSLARRQEVNERLDALKRDHAEVRGRVSQMEQDMVTLKGKLADAKVKLKSLQPSPQAAPGPGYRQEKASPTERKVNRAMARFDRLEAQVESLEARVRSYDMGGPSPEVWSDAGEPNPLVEEELAQLKARIKANNSQAGERQAENPAHQTGN